MRLGTYLKNLRTARDWTQPDAAEKIGVEQSYLSKLENGKATPSETILDDLVRAYQIDLDKMVRILSPDELTQLSFYAPIAERRAATIKTQTIILRTSLAISLLLIAMGAALVSAGLIETFSNNIYVYESKGVISPGKTALMFNPNRELLQAAATEQLAVERVNMINENNLGKEITKKIASAQISALLINARVQELEAKILMAMDPAVLFFKDPQPLLFNREINGGTRQYQYSRTQTQGLNYNKWSINAGVFFLMFGFVGFYVGRVWR